MPGCGPAWNTPGSRPTPQSNPRPLTICMLPCDVVCRTAPPPPPPTHTHTHTTHTHAHTCTRAHTRTRTHTHHPHPHPPHPPTTTPQPPTAAPTPPYHPPPPAAPQRTHVVPALLAGLLGRLPASAGGEATGSKKVCRAWSGAAGQRQRPPWCKATHSRDSLWPLHGQAAHTAAPSAAGQGTPGQRGRAAAGSKQPHSTPVAMRQHSSSHASGGAAGGDALVCGIHGFVPRLTGGVLQAGRLVVRVAPGVGGLQASVGPQGRAEGRMGSLECWFEPARPSGLPAHAVSTTPVPAATQPPRRSVRAPGLAARDGSPDLLPAPHLFGAQRGSHLLTGGAASHADLGLDRVPGATQHPGGPAAAGEREGGGRREEKVGCAGGAACVCEASTPMQEAHERLEGTVTPPENQPSTGGWARRNRRAEPAACPASCRFSNSSSVRGSHWRGSSMSAPMCLHASPGPSCCSFWCCPSAPASPPALCAGGGRRRQHAGWVHGRWHRTQPAQAWHEALQNLSLMRCPEGSPAQRCCCWRQLVVCQRAATLTRTHLQPEQSVPTARPLSWFVMPRNDSRVL